MYQTNGVVLKKTNVGETDAVFIIYTKDFGKIQARAQGIKKENAKLKGHLEPMSLSSISFVLGKNGERLVGASLINYWFSIRSDWDKLKTASYIIEVVDKHCLPGDKNESLWELLVGSLVALEKGDFSAKELTGFLGAFEEKFLASLGYAGEKDIRMLENI